MLIVGSRQRRDMKPDQQRVSDVVMETVIKLCASGLEGSRARVHGIIGVTVDDSDVFLIHINDTTCYLSASREYSRPDVSPAPLPPDSSSPAACSSARKRARHRLVFQSPDAVRRRPNEHAEVAAYSVPMLLDHSVASHTSSINGIMCESEPDFGTVPTGDAKLLPHDQTPVSASKPSVVVVDSDDEDVKVVVVEQASDMMSSSSVMSSSVNADDTLSSAADTVSSLQISDVVGSQSLASLTVIKDDLNSCLVYNDVAVDDYVAVMEDENCNTSQLWTKATRPPHVKVTL